MGFQGGFQQTARLAGCKSSFWAGGLLSDDLQPTLALSLPATHTPGGFPACAPTHQPSAALASEMGWGWCGGGGLWGWGNERVARHSWESCGVRVRWGHGHSLTQTDPSTDDEAWTLIQTQEGSV